jgi:hypothetical protein
LRTSYRSPRAQDAEIAHNLWVHHRMLPPNSRFKHYWDLVLLVLVLYYAIIIPLQLAFEVRTSDAVEIIFDFVFMADMVINFRTTFYDEQNQIVLSDRVVAMRYLKSWCASPPSPAACPCPLLPRSRRTMRPPCQVHVRPHRQLPVQPGARHRHSPATSTRSPPPNAPASRAQLVVIIEAGGASTAVNNNIFGIFKMPRLFRLSRLWAKVEQLSSAGLLRILMHITCFTIGAHWVGCFWWMVRATCAPHAPTPRSAGRRRRRLARRRTTTATGTRGATAALVAAWRARAGTAARGCSACRRARRRCTPRRAAATTRRRSRSSG